MAIKETLLTYCMTLFRGGIGSISDFKVSLHDSMETVIGSDIGFHI